MVRLGISPKPAALAVAAMTRIVDGTSTLGPLKGLPNRRPCVCIPKARRRQDRDRALDSRQRQMERENRLQREAQRRTIACVSTRPAASGEVTALDMMGNATAVPYRDGVANAEAVARAFIAWCPATPTCSTTRSRTPEGYVAR